MATPNTSKTPTVGNAQQQYFDNAAKQTPTTERKQPIPVYRSTRGATPKKPGR